MAEHFVNPKEQMLLFLIDADAFHSVRSFMEAIGNALQRIHG